MSFFKNLFSKSKTEAKNIERGTFTDSRDGKIYKTVKIGNQVWMAENLCYKPNSGNYWAYDDNQSNVARYGYLYDWQTAKKVCPSGWHLPSEEEFETLLRNFGGSYEYAFNALKEGGSSGFSALFGGYRYYTGEIAYIGISGNWWSSSKAGPYYQGDAWCLFMDGNCPAAFVKDNYESFGLSVRCLQD